MPGVSHLLSPQGPMSPDKESIFSVMTRQAQEHGAINLGQGFPDFPPPGILTQALAQASMEVGATMQYAPARGTLGMRRTLASLQKEMYGLTYDPMAEVLVTNGGTEAIFCAILALCSPGDEVLVFEPMYDSYIAAIHMAGARAVPVRLVAPEFRWDSAKLRAQIGPKTRLVIMNSPHNPTGRVFTEGEQRELAQLVEAHDCWLLSDEVYEHMTYENTQHRPMASLPGMRDRVVSVGSAGKTFGATGLKVGWAMGPSKAIDALLAVHQYNVFCVSHPMQRAVELALGHLPLVRAQLQSDYQKKRDLFLDGLRKLGLSPLVPLGSYFILLPAPQGMSDREYCNVLVRNQKVAAIPMGAFDLRAPADGERRAYVRLCFAKQEGTIHAALEALSTGR